MHRPFFERVDDRGDLCSDARDLGEGRDVYDADALAIDDLEVLLQRARERPCTFCGALAGSPCATTSSRMNRGRDWTSSVTDTHACRIRAALDDE